MTALLESELPDDVRGQYASDRVFHANDPELDKDSHGVKDARGDGDLWLHQPEGYLYDEASSLVPNEATGIAFGARLENPDDDLVRVSGLNIVEAVDAEIAKRRRNKTDDAEAWLKAHDPEYTEHRADWT